MTRGFGWRQARRASVVFSEVPDDTLSEWAIASDARALTELHRRYAGVAAQFAAVVSGRPREASEVVASAFTITFTELIDDAPAISDPFLPRLLRSVRTLALVGADRGVDAAQLAASVGPGTSPTLLAELFSGLSEPERSALWLSEVAELSSADAGLALAVSGGTSTLRWTRPRSLGLDALVQRANTTLGDHRASAVAALAGVEALIDEDHLDALLTEWPKRKSWPSRWSRPSLDWSKIIGDRDASFGRVARLAVIVLLVLVSLVVVLNRRDTGTAQSGLPAKHVRAGGSSNGGSSPAGTNGGSLPGTRGAPPVSPTNARHGGASGTGGATGNGSSNRTGHSPTSSGNRSGNKGGGGSAPSAIGLSAASGTTVGVGTTGGGSQPPSSGTGNGTPPSGGGQPTTPTVPPSGGFGGGPGPTAPPSPPSTTSSTTQPPDSTPTTTAPPTTAPPTTAPATTAPATTAPPTTEPPTTAPPTTDPATTEPPTTAPPTTLPPVP